MLRPPQAVILSAGAGARAWPFGEIRQKSTIPVCNVPVVRRVAQLIQGLGIGRIAVVIGAHGQQVKHAVGDLEGVAFVEQREPSGTAHAALLGWDALDRDAAMLVVCGDILTCAEDLARLADGLSDGVAAAAMVAPLGAEAPNEWLVAYRKDSALLEVVGHDRGGKERLCGAYALSPSARGPLERNAGIFRSVPVGGMPPVEAELGQSIQQMLDEGLEVRAIEAEGPFVDIDKPWHIHQASYALLEHLAAQPAESDLGEGTTISDDAEISGRIFAGRGCHVGRRVVVRGDLWLGDNTSITNGAIIEGHVAVGRDCRVRDYCVVGGGSVIGDHSIVAHGAELWGVLFDRVYLYHYCEMAGVFGSAVDIGAATVCGTLRFDDRDQMHKVCGRSEVPAFGANSSYMGDYSRTGVNAILLPGCKVGSYSCVGPGVVVNEDIPSRTVIMVKQELIRKPWGPEKYGW